MNQFYELLDGQPYLIRRGLHELAAHKLSFAEFASKAAQDDGPFGDHLRPILLLLAQDQTLCEIVSNLLRGRPSSTDLDALYRLRSSGVVSEESAPEMRSCCRLYTIYLTQHLL
jgi:hypothetical protein